MKRKVFLCAILAGIFVSCEEGDEANPIAKACFDYSSDTEIEVGDEIVFNNCSENASTYVWDFGDGEVSTEKNPGHTYEQGGEYTVNLIIANETSADTVSKSITVISTANTENFTFDDQQHSLRKAYITSHDAWETDESGRIHSLVFTESESAYSYSEEEEFTGEGILLSLTIIGRAPYDIEGEYSFSKGSSEWPDQSDVRTVEDMTVLFGATIYKDLDDSVWDEDTMLIFEDDYEQFDCSISKSEDTYTITFEGTTEDGRAISLNFEGEMEKY